MNDEEIKKELSPKNDVIFRRLFGRSKNKGILKDFLEAVLAIRINDVILEKETELMPERINDKLGILDVRAELDDGTMIDIEMQNINQGNIEKRVTYYLNQLYINDFNKGKTYKELNKAIVIGILNFNYFHDIKEYHTIWKMTEQVKKEKTLNEQEIHFIELPKFLKGKINMDKKLDQWLAFIDYSRKELVKMAEEKNNMVREASEEYEYLTGDEAVQRLAFLKRKWELDYNSGMEYAKEEGTRIGIKEGREKGMKEGMKEGREKGIKEGKKEKQIEIAKNMKKMKIEIDIIVKATGLSKDEVESL